MGAKRTTGAICGAKRRDGELCSKKAGWGTDHVGYGACKHHGGNTQSHIGAAGRPSLELLVGYQVDDINPLDALLMCVRIAAAEVSYFSMMIGHDGEDKLTVRPREESVAGKDPEVFDLRKQKQLSLWYQERRAATDRLARYSKMALDAGVAERQVAVAEQMGDILARFIEGVLDGLRLTTKQKSLAPEIVRKQLALVAVSGGGQAA